MEQRREWRRNPLLDVRGLWNRRRPWLLICQPGRFERERPLLFIGCRISGLQCMAACCTHLQQTYRDCPNVPKWSCRGPAESRYLPTSDDVRLLSGPPCNRRRELLLVDWRFG